MKWEVISIGGLEKDKYDEKNAYYLVYVDKNAIVRGCMRLIEMQYDCMFDLPFDKCLPKDRSEYKKGVWEASRLAKDHNYVKGEYTRAESYKVLPTLLGAVTYLSFYHNIFYKTIDIKEILLLVFPEIKDYLESAGWTGVHTIKTTEQKDKHTDTEKNVLTIFYRPSLENCYFYIDIKKSRKLPNLHIQSGKDIINYFDSTDACLKSTEHFFDSTDACLKSTEHFKAWFKKHCCMNRIFN